MFYCLHCAGDNLYIIYIVTLLDTKIEICRNMYYFKIVHNFCLSSFIFENFYLYPITWLPYYHFHNFLEQITILFIYH